MIKFLINKNIKIIIQSRQIDKAHSKLYYIKWNILKKLNGNCNMVIIINYLSIVYVTV